MIKGRVFEMTSFLKKDQGFLKKAGFLLKDRGFLKKAGFLLKRRGFLKMTSFAMTSFLKNKFYRGISKEYRGIFEKGRVFAKKTGFFENDIICYDIIFLKINFTGEFLKNTHVNKN